MNRIFLGKEVGETLAHETGHFLGAADTYTMGDKNLLMYGITDQRGRKLRKADVNLNVPLRNVASSQCIDNNNQGSTISNLVLKTCNSGYSDPQSLFLDAYSWPP